MPPDLLLSRRSVLTALAAGLAAAAASRAHARDKVVPPRVEVDTLAPISGQAFRVSLSIDNQNTEPLEIGEVRFTVRVLGQGVITGRSPGTTVAALDRATLSVDVDADALPSIGELRSAATNGKLDYELYGNLSLGRKIKKTLPFQGRGALTLTSGS